MLRCIRELGVYTPNSKWCVSVHTKFLNTLQHPILLKLDLCFLIIIYIHNYTYVPSIKFEIKRYQKLMDKGNKMRDTGRRSKIYTNVGRQTDSAAPGKLHRGIKNQNSH